MKAPDCPFCTICSDRIFYTGRSVLVIWDGFPVSPGHALIIPKRHFESWFEADSDVRAEMLEAITNARDAILERYQPAGFNIGVNDGITAGQTIPHLHLHVIPRYAGDVPDPRGGVRHVIPEKADYWSGGQEQPSAAPARRVQALVRGEDDPLLPHLLGHLDDSSHIQIAVAFILLNSPCESSRPAIGASTRRPTSSTMPMGRTSLMSAVPI